MPICQNCKKRWSWSYTMKQIFRFKSKMNCCYCGKVQYQSQSSRNIQSFLFSSLAILCPIILIFQLPIIIFVLINLLLATGLYLSLPFMFEISNEEERLW